jgi:hypothetical protein
VSDDIAIIDDTDTAASPPAGRSGRRPIDRGLMLASLVIAGGLVLIGWGLLTAVTGDDGIERPDPIESVLPVENAVQVLQQDRVIVDLEFGYDAVLIVDGIELPTTLLGQVVAEPGEQVTLPPTAVFDPGNAVISFQPTEGAPIEEFVEGRHEAVVVFWKTVDGRDEASSYRWAFNVV